ncbi:GNAT family N-acetyltransferase [Chloroflexota bacterium]
MTQADFTIRSATDKDHKELANLIHFEVHVHRHLDWKPPLDWVGCHPFLIAEKDGKIIASLACPPDLPSISWIRMFAVSSDLKVEHTWNALWNEALPFLKKKDIKWVAAIPIHAWFQTLLRESSFRLAQRVAMLSWERHNIPTGNFRIPAQIRPMTQDDIKNIHVIDAESFVPLWQNSPEALELAFRQSAVATVMEDKGRIVGYQISTSTPIGGHIARLAVHPQVQRKGVGYALLYDVLSVFTRRGARTVTVNTQKDNLISLSLYKKAGFQLTGEEYPIFQLAIS